VRVFVILRGLKNGDDLENTGFVMVVTFCFGDRGYFLIGKKGYFKKGYNGIRNKMFRNDHVFTDMFTCKLPRKEGCS
jgi:hypothetical protein